jgi:NDP-sugar pyrophosphorylase family protein
MGRGMNIVIPMAGNGTRFAEAGYKVPKPFIVRNGKSMIEHVIANVASPDARYYLICRLSQMMHLQDTKLIERSDIAIIPTFATEGQACSVLRARAFIDSHEPLLIANSDQWVRYPFSDWARARENGHGAILTCNVGEDASHSYARCDESGRVLETAEKRQISHDATVGIYYFREGHMFVNFADEMIRDNQRVNGEFYVAPVFNLMIAAGLTVLKCDCEYFSMGTPEELERNLSEIGRWE